ncbi:Ldh family oxidoreductase [Polaromonas sp.]|uniref:Ldh family oxidoreductase n=1 Tax=Polaromonas sp. TaxID=1869339 RepID=UPI00286B64F7|nr:Ldh family oxidoreductase [Polaromonas sp.]
MARAPITDPVFHRTARLEQFAAALFSSAGMDEEKAQTLGRFLVLTDAMGRRTHGLAMACLYLADIQKGGMKLSGEPQVIKDNGISAVWDGDYLPGLWLVNKAMEQAIPRASQYGLAAVAIRKSHHIGCLAALVKQAADRGLVAQISNSDPAGARVAPYGGTEALFTPNPFAMGYPGDEHPVLIDICASITTTSMTRQKFAAGEQFEHPWLLDAQGSPTRDPAVLENQLPRGSLQLLGGQEYGHKGFGLALGIEALSQGLSGQGRRDAPQRWGGNVFLQVIDPEHFAGREAFNDQMNHLSQRCRANRPIDADRPVRMPGDQAARSIAQARSKGISYDLQTWGGLAEWALKLNVDIPSAERG